MTPLLQVNQLDIAFRQGRTLTQRTDGVTFSVNPGEILALVGESGCGKSITAMSILGLLPRQGQIMSGQILFDGRDLTTLDEKELDKIRGREIAMIFQDIMYSLNPVFPIGNQLIEGMRRHLRLPKREAEERAVALLKRTGIQDAAAVMCKYPHMLSGGMRQRVMIAMALACKPKLLIADEPTTALDVTIQAQILRLMNELKREKGTAIMFITHDLGVINQMADDVAVLYCGQVVEMASVDVIFDGVSPYQHPYTEGLMESIPRLDTPVNTRLAVIPGSVPHPLNLPKGCKFCTRCKYATDRCRAEEPEYREIEPGHLIRCHYPMKEVRHD